jgi:hypothetical protein
MSYSTATGEKWSRIIPYSPAQTRSSNDCLPSRSPAASCASPCQLRGKGRQKARSSALRQIADIGVSRISLKTQAAEIKPLFSCRIYVQNNPMIYGYARVSTDGQHISPDGRGACPPRFLHLPAASRSISAICRSHHATPSSINSRGSRPANGPLFM